MDLWKTEFGDEYEPPAFILDYVREGKLSDQSWHNNAMPCFLTSPAGSDGMLCIWVDAAVDREINCGRRFIVAAVTEDDPASDGVHLFMTDDEQDLKAFIDIYLRNVESSISWLAAVKSSSVDRRAAAATRLRGRQR